MCKRLCSCDGSSRCTHKGIKLCIRKSKYAEVFNLGSGAPASNKQLLDTVQKHTGKMNIEIYGNRPGDPAYLVADITKAKKILDWEPTQSSIDNVVATAVKWYNKVHKKEYNNDRKYIKTKKTLVPWIIEVKNSDKNCQW